MTVGDFAGKSSGTALIKVQKDGEVIAAFDPTFWEAIVPDILGLKIDSFSISTVFMHKAEVVITVASDATDQDEADQEDQG